MTPFSARPPVRKSSKVDETIFLRVIWSGVIISFIFLLGRLVARWKCFQKLFWDDGFAILAWLLALGTAIIWQLTSKFMYQFLAVNSGELWPPPGDFEADSERYYRESLVVWLCFYTGLWAVKISFLLFFKRLGQNVARQQGLWWGVFLFTGVAYVISMGDMPYACLADSFDKLMRNCSTKSAARHERVVLWVNCILDIVSDCAIMALPISMLWGVQMSLRRKAALMGIFSLAIITTVFAVIRVTVVSTFTKQPEPSWLYLWNSVEHCIAIIMSCLASFRSLFVQQRSRPRKPTYYFQDTIRNMFLRDKNRARPLRRSAGMDGVASCSELSTQAFTTDQPGNSEVASDSAITSWTELAVPASIVYPKADV